MVAQLIFTSVWTHGGDGGGGGNGMGDGGVNGLAGMPHTQQLNSGRPNLLPTAHSCPGTTLPSAQWPSAA